jgi:hypothetical protein
MRAHWPTAVLASLVLALAGCGGAEPPDLFAEYLESDRVLNDPFATDTCCEDRMAALATFGPPDLIVESLLAAQECGDEAGCGLTSSANAAAAAFAGNDGSVFARGILVKHDNGGGLEYVPLLVAQNAHEETVVVDRNGDAFDSLDDFRAGTDVTDAGDWILTAEDLTEVDGRTEIVTVPGHAAPQWITWLIGGAIAAAVLALAAVAAFRIRYYRSRVRPEAPS